MRSAVLVFLCLISISASCAEKPNIIIILVDDFGRELISCLGGESYATANIDRMASEGMTFDICYATPIRNSQRSPLASTQSIADNPAIGTSTLVKHEPN